ncbi:hypothetical protein, unknown function [Leishmania tarentolae]|uniref:Leucine-rich repeat protein n=1 Tax=Leishmania tarentolae TaxID=5689 RepID=A0A640K764_LEITA|nr:hypothetical protein, unknown function [Leishmania tarentolae]
MNHGRDVLAAVPSQAPGRTDALSASVVELLLHGVTGLSAHTLASVGRCCVSLRTVDLTSTSVTDDELHALVYGILETPCKDSKPATCPATLSPLACLEDVRLTACRGVTCVSALAALPRLRRLDLRASGVRQVSDLVGCRLLEEVVLTRCEHVTELCPLWQLPRLRCVEADGVRQLQQHRALIPPAASAAEEDERADTCLVAPLARLNLSQASVIRGASVGYLARRLLDWSGRFTSLMVLLLDYTDADDDTLRALAGFPTQESGPGRFMERCLPVASSLRELSLVGCTRVHHLGPLGVLPQLTRLMAAHSGVEHVDGLQYSRTLECLSLSHCTRVGAISPLAYAASLRCADLSHTPLNDAALLRFVYPTVVERGTAQQYSHIDKVGALLQVCSVFPTPLVPSQVEELRLRHCTSLLHISCVAHLPRLRRLDVCHTTVFDRSFVGFFSCTRALLRTQLWPTAHATGIAVDDGEVSEAAPLPDEEALLAAWRRDTEAVVAMPQDTSAASGEIDGGGTVVTAGGPLHTAEFDFAAGAVNTLTHVCLAYCMEVRCIAPFALFPQLVSLDVTGTAVDSASLLTFVNVLLEGCRCRAPDVPLMRLELEGNSLRPRALPTRQRGAAPVVSLFTRGSDAGAAAVEPPRRCRRPFTLTTLTLAWCDYLTDVRCCAAVPSLRHLDVCGTPVDNASVAAFSPEAFALVSAASEEEAQWWHNHRCSLLSLDVSYCCRVTDIASLFASPAHPLPGSGSDRKRASSADCPPFSLMELRLRHSGVMSTKEELRALDPFGRCVLL